MAKQKGTRRGGRRRAFEVLYGLCFCPAADGLRVDEALRLTPRAGSRDTDVAQGDREDFATELVHGVWEHAGKLDGIISDYSRHWKLNRIARIELTILRLAMYEMLYRDDIPLKVAINEAVELAKRFGDDKAKNFINGILDAVAKAVEDGQLRIHR